MVAEEAVTNAMGTMESGAGQARPECRCTDETRTTDMRGTEMSAADSGKGHPAAAAHSAAKTSAVHAAAVAATTTAMAATTTTTSGESRWCKRNGSADRRRHEASEEFVCHRKSLLH